MSIELFERAGASTRRVLAGVRADQWGAPTPCPAWDVRRLVGHFVRTPHWAAAMVAGRPESGEFDGTPADLVAGYDAAVRAAVRAFGVPGALDRVVRSPLGPMPGAALLGIATVDVFTHGWDLARATGRPTDLDPELAEELLAQTRTTVGDAVRGPEGAPFGAATTPPAGASPADRLAAFLGRPVAGLPARDDDRAGWASTGGAG
jgi:uncharacterized protein (TIGR03086 family)